MSGAAWARHRFSSTSSECHGGEQADQAHRADLATLDPFGRPDKDPLALARGEGKTKIEFADGVRTLADNFLKFE